MDAWKSAARARRRVAADGSHRANLANMNTTRTGDGGAYIPVRLVSGPDENFDKSCAGRHGSEGAHGQGRAGLRRREQSGTACEVYEPGHPHAESDGFVTYPQISHSEEMTLMVRPARAYEANLVAFASAQQMYSSALQIGGRQ